MAHDDGDESGIDESGIYDDPNAHHRAPEAYVYSDLEEEENIETMQ